MPPACAKGRGGRPPGFDAERYKKRDTVERAINKLKQFRAVATRYDKRGYVVAVHDPLHERDSLISRHHVLPAEA